MVDIKISGRKVAVSQALREQVESKIGGALKVFDIKPMSCDVVLRADKTVPVEHVVTVIDAVNAVNAATGANHKVILATSPKKQ